MAKHAFETGVMLIGRAQQNGSRELLAGQGLHGQQALEAEHHVAVAKLFTQGGILNMRGTGAFMNVLGGKIVV